MNKVILIGNLTRDPETRTTPSGATCAQFGLAVRRRHANAQGQRETDFFNVTAWRQLGDLCCKYLSKGKKTMIEGEIHIRQYDAKDGSKRTAVDIIAASVEFLTPNANSAGQGSAQAQLPQEPAFAADNGFTVVDNDELPF